MKPRKNTARRLMVILMGAILFIASVIQLIQGTGQFWMLLIFAFLGLFEIGLAVALMIIQNKVSPKA
jgi:hypothetical protein